MAFDIVSNNAAKNRVVVRFTGATNEAVNSFSSGTESIVGMRLTQIWAGCNNNIGVLYGRGATTLFRTGVTDSVWHDFAGNGVSIDADLNTANVVVTIAGANNFAVCEFSKEVE